MQLLLLCGFIIGERKVANMIYPQFCSFCPFQNILDDQIKIFEAVKSNHFKISKMKNQFRGKSRSSTITLAFLIQKTNLTLEDAIVQVAHHTDFETFHCDTYLIFVIFFTQAKFLENEIYTEKTRKLRQNTQ